MEIESNGDEDTAEGPVFKRRRAIVATTSHSTTIGRPASFRDHPPSASSPHGLLALEGDGESAPGDEQTPPAPELPAVLQHALKCFQRGVAKDLDEDVIRERMGLNLGEFVAQPNALASKAEVRTKEQLALVEAKAKEDLALVEEKKKDELAQQARVFATREIVFLQELSSLRQSEKDVKKRLFAKGQEYTDLESRVLPLRSKVVELEEEAEATKAKMAKLEERATNQEVQLGRVEGELTQQAEAFKKTEAKLIEDAADAYATRFEDALSQVTCVLLEMDTSPFVTSNCVVDGQVVPRPPPF